MASKLWRTPSVVPALSYEDVPAAVEFLTRAFGFRERAEARLTGHGFVLAWMDVGDGLISLSTSGGHGRSSPRTTSAITQSVKVYVDGIDGHFARAKAAGAVVISEPGDKFWGGRVYEAKDLEGHYWEFSERNRELDATEWKLPPGIKMGA
ncbi:MAG TPA: VOC family protein [Candidatus Acidoferrum sp.]|nr:VOC family protein [Candidatus Acidoferrum sp.]